MIKKPVIDMRTLMIHQGITTMKTLPDEKTKTNFTSTKKMIIHQNKNK
jgi:hypothetical protein